VRRARILCLPSSADAEPPQASAVLNATAEKGDWGKPLPPGVHRGIAQFMGYEASSNSWSTQK
jgi:hypothetical protein